MLAEEVLAKSCPEWGVRKGLQSQVPVRLDRRHSVAGLVNARGQERAWRTLAEIGHERSVAASPMGSAESARNELDDPALVTRRRVEACQLEQVRCWSLGRGKRAGEDKARG